MIAVPALRMMAFTSAKSVLMSPGTVIRSVTPRTAESRTSSAILKASSIDVSAAVTESSRSLGMTMSVSTFSRSDLDALLGLGGAPLALEGKRPRDHADRQDAEPARDLGHDRRRAGTRAATLAGGDEDHVGLHQGLFDLARGGRRRPAGRSRGRCRPRVPWSTRVRCRV